MKSAILWIGGKYFIRREIIKLFPEHVTYVEVFGGAGHVLFEKEKSKIEIYNDINSDLYNLFCVLRDKTDELYKKLSYTLYSREEFKHCVSTYSETTDDVERAYKFYVLVRQSYVAKQKHWYAIYARKPCWGSAIDLIPEMRERLKEVYIENKDYKYIFKKYDNENTLFYLDPPYLFSTRKTKKLYKYEMTDSQHTELLDLICNAKGKVILSGYDSDLYNQKLKDWSKKTIDTHIRMTVKHEPRREVLWWNF